MTFQSLGGTLAVGCHHFCQAFGNLIKSRRKFCIAGVAHIDFFVACHTVGKNQHGVIGAGITVYGNHIECIVCRILAGFLHCFGRQLQVGGDEAEHGRHIGMNHATALGNTAHMNGFACKFIFNCIFFDECVGGGDGICRMFTAQRHGGQCRNHAGNTARNHAHGQLNPDHTCGANENFLLGQTAIKADQIQDFLHIFTAFVACAGIGIATVGKNRLSFAAFDDFTAPFNGSRRKFILSENTACLCHYIGFDECQVFFAGDAFFDSAVKACCGKALGGTNTAVNFFVFYHLYILRSRPPQEQSFFLFIKGTWEPAAIPCFRASRK